MIKPSARRQSDGFTLLEILVAVTVLGIALVSLLGLHARNIRLTSRTQDMTTATMLASRIVAITKAGELPSEGVTEGKFTTRERESLRFDEIYGGNGSQHFVWKREVTNPGVPGLWLIKVSVGEPDVAPAAELSFFMANKLDILRALGVRRSGRSRAP